MEPPAHSRALLSLDEVRASRLPAFFFDHGEHLLYLDDDLYDLRGGGAQRLPGSLPLQLPRQILKDGVGIEYGWRHAADCACRYCAKLTLPETTQEAVA